MCGSTAGGGMSIKVGSLILKKENYLFIPHFPPLKLIEI